MNLNVLRDIRNQNRLRRKPWLPTEEAHWYVLLPNKNQRILHGTRQELASNLNRCSSQLDEIWEDITADEYSQCICYMQEVAYRYNIVKLIRGYFPLGKFDVCKFPEIEDLLDNDKHK